LLACGAIQGRKTYKLAKAKRCVACAILSFQQKDLPDTARWLQSAIQADPSSLQATRMTAELLETMGSPKAIGWRIRAAQLEPANMTIRLDWAKTALRLHELKSAQDALSGLDDQARATARYHKVAGALEWALGKTAEAQQHYQEATRLEPENPSNILNLATSDLISTNETVLLAARSALQRLATNSPLAIQALRQLALEASKRKALAEAVDYTKQLVTNSSATIGDKLDYLNLLHKMRNTDADSWLAALKQLATNSSADAFALGRWLARNEGPTNALQWLLGLPEAIQTEQPVPIVITECQVAVKDWAGLAGTVADEDWGGAEMLRLALLSLAERSLGQEEEALSLWRQAKRESARHLDKLYALTQLTGAWGWAAEQQAILAEIVSEFPHEKGAVDRLLAQLHDSTEMQELKAAQPNQSNL